ncbi:hypothetical protein LSAT2_025772 [Lamellibrachia satsuma]|nr:hypothetical protein LSAT2_025772 [Lamellibrachia satsuma]
MFRNTSLLLTDLHLATKYNLSVRGRPKAGYHWSESISIIKSTDEDDPSSPPTILPGSFRIVPANSRGLSSSRKVVIFWQPILKKNRNGDIIGYEVSCRRTDDPSPFLPPVNITALSATVARLDSQQDYVISVQAYNSVGRSPKAILNIPKSKDMLPPPGNVVAERSEDRGIITFRWDPVATPVSNYTFFWCQGRVDVTSACSGPLHHRTIPGNVTEMDHLVTHDTDMYALSANNDSGSSGMSKDWICIYDYDGLPGKPIFSFDPFVDARSVSLLWEPLLCSTKIRGRVLNYTLELWMDGVEERLKAFTLPATTTSYKFADLKPYSNYTIKMAALAHIGSQTYEKQISTPESKPGKPPASLNASMTNNHQVILRWRKSPAPNGVITKYEVFAMVNGTEVWTMSVNASKHSVTLEVDGGVTYNFTVMAVNKMGQSPPSKPLCIKTPVRAPGQISLDHLHMDVFNSTVARVKWSRPSHPNGPINNYIVEFTLVDEGGTKIGRVWNKTCPGNETNMNVSVKCNGAKVITRVRVAAVNRDAQNSIGTWSESKNVTLCENPGHRVSWKTVYRIISGVAFLVVIVVISVVNTEILPQNGQAIAHFSTSPGRLTVKVSVRR